MNVSNFFIECLCKHGVTDAFGIPGGVILPFLYNLKKSDIELHLTYHEQTAAFAACGYAQASGKLGVAYATRGPGISNMFTAIAEAYQESIPVLFITAHGIRKINNKQRFSENQELNIVNAVQGITKFAVNIDEIDQINLIERAISEALLGRRGPVLIDVSAKLWDKEIKLSKVIEPAKVKDRNKAKVDAYKIAEEIGRGIKKARRPVVLIGDGLRHCADKETLVDLSKRLKLPVLSSRGSQDLLSGSPYYFGYVGSHGVRYSNFILSKADLIVAIGNRMAFPHDSPSFSPILKRAKIIRIDIDEGEIQNQILDEKSYCLDAMILLNALHDVDLDLNCSHEWIEVCRKLRQDLDAEDCTEPVLKIAEIIKSLGKTTYVCDVGNNEFWFSRAYEKVGCSDRVFMSKSFGTLGSALGKSIGTYYATRSVITCVVGDQGFQYNIQELQYIKSQNLPIKILLVNNNCSRMIADHEIEKRYDQFIHVTNNTGYTTPDFVCIAKAYGIEDKLIELKVSKDISLSPCLPKGRACQDMEAKLDRNRYNILNSL